MTQLAFKIESVSRFGAAESIKNYNYTIQRNPTRSIVLFVQNDKVDEIETRF